MNVVFSFKVDISYVFEPPGKVVSAVADPKTFPALLIAGEKEATSFVTAPTVFPGRTSLLNTARVYFFIFANGHGSGP